MADDRDSYDVFIKWYINKVKVKRSKTKNRLFMNDPYAEI